MDLVTEERFTNCTKCGECIRCYCGNRVCQKCVAKKRGGFPKGLSCYKPCPLCVEPNIYWFKRKGYGRPVKDCGRHAKIE